MNMLEVRLIIDNIKKFGGFREKNILEHLQKIEITMENDLHKVYTFTNKEGQHFDYDFKTHLIVG